MPKLLQINVTANSGSTGKIAEQINQVAQSLGWETYLAYGREMQPCKSELVYVGNDLQVYEHYFEHRLFDNDGLASRLATKQLIRRIESIKPDIINLHNIHDHWLNYHILFSFFKTLSIPIVWTQHDCWSFTGGCAYFDRVKCNCWKDGTCGNNSCPIRQDDIIRRVMDRSRHHFVMKQDLFPAINNLTLVPVSHWLEGLLKNSFLKDKNITTIHNGIDINTFCPMDSKDVRRKYGIGDSCYIIGVANQWSARKGFDDFLQLSTLLPDRIKIVLVALNNKQVQKAKEYGIIGIPRTENIKELAALYSGSIMFCNLTYEDNYPTTNLESIACGTPVLTYRTGGSVEAVSENTGWVVEQGDVACVAKVVSDWLEKTENETSIEEKMQYDCRERAKKEFNKEDRYKEYMDLYNQLLTNQ